MNFSDMTVEELHAERRMIRLELQRRHKRSDKKPAPEALPHWAERIASAVAAEYGITLEAILGREDQQRHSRCRWDFWARLHRRGNALARIGRWVKRDYTTVRHGVYEFEAEAALHPKLEAAE